MLALNKYYVNRTLILLILLITLGMTGDVIGEQKGIKKAPDVLKRAAFSKVLRRLQPLAFVQNSKNLNRRKVVFINWRRLYWGKLEDLTKPERSFGSRMSAQPTHTGYVDPIGSEALRYFTQELRSALRAFENKHCVRIIWRKSDTAMPDVTSQFINFWDKDFGRMKAAQERTPKIQRAQEER